MTLTQAENLIYTTANADATLAGHLGDGKMYNSPILPDNAARPALTFALQPFGRVGQNFSGQEYLTQFNLHLQNNASRQPDRDLAGLVEAQLNTLFSGQTLSDANGRIQLDGYNPPDVFSPELDVTVYQFSFNTMVM